MPRRPPLEVIRNQVEMLRENADIRMHSTIRVGVREVAAADLPHLVMIEAALEEIGATAQATAGVLPRIAVSVLRELARSLRSEADGDHICEAEGCVCDEARCYRYAADELDRVIRDLAGDPEGETQRALERYREARFRSRPNGMSHVALQLADRLLGVTP